MAAHSLAFDLMALLDAPGVGPSRVRKLLKRCEPTGGGSNGPGFPAGIADGDANGGVAGQPGEDGAAVGRVER